MNTPIPSDMTIIDNREAYKRKEFYLRLAMPPKTRDLARLNRAERYRKGCKFQIKLKINREAKERAAERKRVIAAALRIGVTEVDLK